MLSSLGHPPPPRIDWNIEIRSNCFPKSLQCLPTQLPLESTHVVPRRNVLVRLQWFLAGWDLFHFSLLMLWTELRALHMWCTRGHTPRPYGIISDYPALSEGFIWIVPYIDCHANEKVYSAHSVSPTFWNSLEQYYNCENELFSTDERFLYLCLELKVICNSWSLWCLMYA